MTTVQHFLAWVKEKSKKNRSIHDQSSFVSTSTLSVESSSVDPSMKTYVKHFEVEQPDQGLCPDGLPRTPDLMEMLQQSSMTLEEKEAFVNEVRRRAPYRASMKLPAIPREEQRQFMTYKKRQPDSPCHVYEEIPAYALDSDCAVRYTDDLIDGQNGDYHSDGITKFDYHGSVDQGINNFAVPINNRPDAQNRPMNRSIRTANQQHQMPSDSQRNPHRDLIKQHQDTIERHRKTVQQYREALPTPVCTEDDPNILGSDRLYPEDNISDSGYLSSTLKDTLRSSQLSAFSPFTPRSFEKTLTTHNTSTDNDKCCSSQSPPDCKTQMDSITSGNSKFCRLSGISHSFNGSKRSQARECATAEGYKVRGDTKHGDECDSDNRSREIVKDTHVHCKRCRRPHGMYHGKLIDHCVHDVDSNDVNQNLDIEITCDNRSAIRVESSKDDTSSAILHKAAPLIRCNSSPAPLNLPLTVAPPEKELHTIPATQTLPIPKSGSSRILTNGSLGSNRSAASNESPNDSCNSAKSRLSMSSSDSGNSSIYTFSGSEKDSTLLRESNPLKASDAIKEQSETPTVESDCSNDTFSEYDTHSRDTSPCVMNDDYTDFLSKVKQNHFLKIDVRRVIRESESSEYESSSDIYFLSSKEGQDSMSLTTVSSMSDLSVLDLEGLPQGQSSSKRFSRSAVNRRRVRFARVVSSDESDARSSQVSSGKSGSHKPDNRKYVKRKSAMKSADKTELYCLPEFSTGVYGDSEHLTDFDRLERLSCRATTLTPNPTKTGSAVTSPTTSPTAGLLATSMAPCKRGQNKLLSDLMKRNHDRQLFIL